MRSALVELPARPAATSLSHLEPSQRLLIYGLRRWIMGLHERGAWHWSLAWDAFAVELGPTISREALRALDALVRELAASSRRRFRYHHPCCPLLTPDEVTVLGLAAACQAENAVHREAVAHWLVHPRGFERLIRAGSDFAAALAAADLRLEAPLAARREAVATAGPLTAGPATAGPGTAGPGTPRPRARPLPQRARPRAASPRPRQ